MARFEGIKFRRVVPKDASAIAWSMMKNKRAMTSQYEHLPKGKRPYEKMAKIARNVLKAIQEGVLDGHVAIDPENKNDPKTKGIVGFVGFSWQKGFSTSVTKRFRKFVADPAKPWVYEHWMFVDKDFMGKGIANELRQKNMAAIQLPNRPVEYLSNARSDNVRRQKMDSRAGFEWIGMYGHQRVQNRPGLRALAESLAKLPVERRAEKIKSILKSIGKNPKNRTGQKIHVLARKTVPPGQANLRNRRTNRK